MSTETVIPSSVREVPGPLRLAVRGHGFQLDLLDTIYALSDLADQVRNAGGTHRDYLDQVRGYVQAQTSVTLTYGEADWLNDHLELEYASAKKKRRDSIAAALTSPSSTASTPAD